MEVPRTEGQSLSAGQEQDLNSSLLLFRVHLFIFSWFFVSDTDSGVAYGPALEEPVLRIR